MSTGIQDLIFPNLPEITITRNKHQDISSKKELGVTKKNPNLHSTSNNALIKGSRIKEYSCKKFKKPFNGAMKSASNLEKLQEHHHEIHPSTNLDSNSYGKNYRIWVMFKKS